MERNPGTQVTPDVSLVRPLSEGAMGDLWVGHHAGLDQPVAVKFILERLVGDAGALARFQREARAAAQLKSPNVVRTHDYGTTDGRVPYIVMELLKGETLGERMRRGRRLGIGDTVRLVQHVAGALAEAHACGIIHRDIKPDNIFLMESGGPLWAKVLDFGMAKQANTRGGSIVTATGVIVGTPEYMSPEQVLGSKHVDHRADLWALGVVTYRVLFGELPFVHTTPHGLIFAICEGQYCRPSERGAPAVLDRWFDACLAPQLDRRFGSGADLAAAFESAVAEAGEGMAAIGRTVVGQGDSGSVTKLSEAPTVASASYSTRTPDVGSYVAPPVPAAGQAARKLDSDTLESVVPVPSGSAPGPPNLDPATLESPSRAPGLAGFGPSSTPDGGTMQCDAPSGPVRVGSPDSLRQPSAPIAVETADSEPTPVHDPARSPADGLPGGAHAAALGRPSQPGVAAARPAAWPVHAGSPGAARSELPTILPAQELRAARARRRRIGWWLALVATTVLTAVGVGTVLVLSPDLAGRLGSPSGEADGGTSSSSSAASSARRGTTELDRAGSAQPDGATTAASDAASDGGPTAGSASAAADASAPPPRPKGRLPSRRSPSAPPVNVVPSW